MIKQEIKQFCHKNMASLIFYVILVGVVAKYIIGIAIVAQLRFFLFFVSNIFFGCFFLNSWKQYFIDKVFYYLTAFLIGLSGYFIIGYVGLHRFIIELFNLNEVNLSYVITMLFAPIIFLGLRWEYRSKIKLELDVKVVTKVFTIAFFVWLIAYAGFKPMPYNLEASDISANIEKKYGEEILDWYDEISPGSYQITEKIVTNQMSYGYKLLLVELLGMRKEIFWGNPVDKCLHLGYQVDDINRIFLPLRRDGHVGVQIYHIVAANFVFAPDSMSEAYYAASKVSLLTALVMWFVFIYSFVFICLKIFSIEEKYLNLIVFSAAFFEVLMVPFSSEHWGEFKRLFSISESLYFNVTHLYSVTIGMVSVALLLLGERTEKKLFVVAAFLIAISFFFKPSVFVIAAPAFCCFALLGMLAEKKLDLNYIKGMTILFLVPVFYLVYRIYSPDYTEIGSTNNFAIRPFLLFKQVSGFFLPTYLQVNSFIQILYVCLLGFAAFVPLLLLSVFQACKVKLTFSSIWDYLLAEREGVLFLTLLFLGICSGVFLVQDSFRLMHMNFSWSLGAGYILALPFLLHKVLCREGKMRQISIALIFMHIVFGIFSLLTFFLFI